MSRPTTLVLITLALSDLLAIAAQQESAEPTLSVSAFSSEHSLTVHATPDEAFDAFTGDISGWWDHSYSEHPSSLGIEPHPGGHFIEHFDVVHRLDLEAVEGGTRATGLGKIQPGWEVAVQGVWHQFPGERFKPSVEGGL